MSPIRHHDSENTILIPYFKVSFVVFYIDLIRFYNLLQPI